MHQQNWALRIEMIAERFWMLLIPLFHECVEMLFTELKIKGDIP
jgi:hypothetical protein